MWWNVEASTVMLLGQNSKGSTLVEPAPFRKVAGNPAAFAWSAEDKSLWASAARRLPYTAQ